MITDLRRVLSTLAAGQVEFILIGGGAAIAHGSARLTLDADVVYARDPANVKRLVEALRPYTPYLRGAPPGLPFRWTAETILAGLNFTLETTLGNIDVFGEVAGGGTYAELLPHTEELRAFGITCRCVDLETLIVLKRAAGRPRDFDAIAELEALLEERDR